MIVGILIGLLLSLNSFISNKSELYRYNKPKHEQTYNNQSYINPTPFKTGYLKKRDGVCERNVSTCFKYPFTPEYVNYGRWGCNEKCCDNLIFNSPP